MHGFEFGTWKRLPLDVVNLYAVTNCSIFLSMEAEGGIPVLNSLVSPPSLVTCRHILVGRERRLWFRSVQPACASYWFDVNEGRLLVLH